MEYNPKAIEPKWQKYWEEHETFKTDVWDFSKPKYYVLDMFPYPSGVGLHAGHPEGYTATDIVSRMKRMQGYNVLHPMGYDSFLTDLLRKILRPSPVSSKSWDLTMTGPRWLRHLILLSITGHSGSSSSSILTDMPSM